MIRILALLALYSTLAAQDRVTRNFAHAWLTYDGDHRLKNSPWSLHLEGHWRRHDAGLTWQQLLLRPGITYSFNPKVSASLGYAFVETWPYGQPPGMPKFTEHRLWEQLALRYKTGKVSWGSRFRFENRWLEQPLLSEYRFENRLRMMQKLAVPLSERAYFTAFDEFWLYVKPYVSSSVIDQNRAYAAIGWRLASDWQLETGYMHQGILRRSGLVFESNHTVRITLVSKAPFGGR